MMKLTQTTLINPKEITHLHEGSVKSIYQNNNNLLFKFSDRYSIYDWGEMPDHIDQKGNCLSIMAFLFFKKLEEEGFSHHCTGLRENSNSDKYLEVEKVNKYMPEKVEGKWLYRGYSNRPTDALVPLEVIFRLGASKGSSILKRRPELNEGDRFDEPMIEFSTKLEPIDRNLTDDEAIEIAGLSIAEFKTLKETTAQLASWLSNIVSDLKLELWDGKFEFAFQGNYPNRSFKLVDSIGLDELRITIEDSFPLSKEFLRQCYIDSEWFKNIQFCKKKYGDDWKDRCIKEHNSTPSPLRPQEKELIELIYKAFTNDLSKLIDNKYIFSEDITLAKLRDKINQHGGKQ